MRMEGYKPFRGNSEKVKREASVCQLLTPKGLLWIRKGLQHLPVTAEG